MKKVNVAILGSGRMGRRHADAYKKHPKVNIVGFYDIQEKLSQSLALEYDGTIAFDSPESILEDPHINAVSICTPNAMHFKLIEKSIINNKDILVEKPIVTSSKECDLINSMMKNSSSKLMVGHTHRFFPCNLALKSILNNREVGQPQIVSTFDYIPGRTLGEKIPPWIKDSSLSGGGVFMTDLIHTVDKISWLLDSPITKVYAPMLSNFIMGSDVEDGGIANIWLENGVTATCVHACPSPGKWDMSTKIIGSKGEISLEFAGKLQIFKESIKTINYEYEGDYSLHSSAGFFSEIDEFVNSIINDREPKINYKDGIQAVRTILALYQSYEKKSPVTL